MEWRGAGYRSEDRDAVALRLRGAAEQCDHCVRFRIAGPYADLSVPIADCDKPF